MEPSDSANFRSGYLRSTGDHSRSVAALIALSGVMVIMQSIGAPASSPSIVDDEPMCRQITVPSSEHALKNGSQWSPKMCGHPRRAGFSEKVTAWQPLAAMRLTSFAIWSGLQIGGIESRSEERRVGKECRSR